MIKLRNRVIFLITASNWLRKKVHILWIKGHNIENMLMFIFSQSTNKLKNELIVTIQRMNTDKSQHTRN